MARRLSGQIPRAGSTGASTFTSRRISGMGSYDWNATDAAIRARRFQRAARSTTPMTYIPMINQAEWRWNPQTSMRAGVQSGPLGPTIAPILPGMEPLTFRGRSGSLYSSFGTVPTAPGWKRISTLHKQFPEFALLPHIGAGAQLALATREDRFGKKRQLVDLKGIKKALNRLLAIAGLPHVGARFVVWHVARWCFMEIISRTPLDTGNAAANWTLSPQVRGKGRGYGRVGFRIGSDVEYIKYLEFGHQSYPPQAMMRSTFNQAAIEIRNVMDVLIEWWKAEKTLLRNIRFDADLSAGVPYNEEAVEQSIPNMSWQKLYSMLHSRLQLTDVSELNTSAALALRINDPKDWHTVPADWKSPTHTFMAREHKKREPIVETMDIPVGFSEFEEVTRVVGHRDVTLVTHVSDEALPKTTVKQVTKDWFDVGDVQSQAQNLERQWRGEKK